MCLVQCVVSSVSGVVSGLVRGLVNILARTDSLKVDSLRECIVLYIALRELLKRIAILLTAQECRNRTLTRNMATIWDGKFRDPDVSMAKVRSRELRNHWYEYISLPLKCRLYSQILK